MYFIHVKCNIVLLLLVNCFILPSSGLAQEDSEKNWHIFIFAKTNYSTKVWSRDFDKSSFQGYPDYKYTAGYGFSVVVQKDLNPYWHLNFSSEFVKRNSSYNTSGVVSFLNENGQSIYIKCDKINQNISQVLFHTGVGYRVLPFLFIELTPYLQMDVTREHFKICETIDWTEDKNFKKAFDYGFSPSIRFLWKKWSVSASYIHGLGTPVKIKLTDAIGAEIGTYGNQYRMFSLGFGFRIF